MKRSDGVSLGVCRENRMKPNPYRSPHTECNPKQERHARWGLRLPMAVICACFVPLFLASLASWSVILFQRGASSEDGRLAMVYVPLSILGIAAFGLLAAGLFRKQPRLIRWGIGFFMIGALVQMVMLAMAGG
jgi:hypothetical protein